MADTVPAYVEAPSKEAILRAVVASSRCEGIEVTEAELREIALEGLPELGSVFKPSGSPLPSGGEG